MEDRLFDALGGLGDGATVVAAYYLATIKGKIQEASDKIEKLDKRVTYLERLRNFRKDCKDA